MSDREHPLSADLNTNDRTTHWENAFERQEISAEGTRSKNETLPPSLGLTSAKQYSFLTNDSPDESFYTGMDSLDLESGNLTAGRPDEKNPICVNDDASLKSEVIIKDVGKGNLNLEGKRPTRKSLDGAAVVLGSSNTGKDDSAKCQNTAEYRILSRRSTFEFAKRGMSNVTREVPQTAVRDTTRGELFSQSLDTSTNRSDVMNEGQNHAKAFTRCKSAPSDLVTSKGKYAVFKTKSSKFERRNLRMISKTHGEEKAQSESICRRKSSRTMVVPAGRYFDALKGPELEILKDSEELLLPPDQTWPFLLRFPIACFGITLGLGSQAVLWKTLATSSSMNFLHIPLGINFVLWCLALVALVSIFITYSLKCLLYFEAVRREYYHPVRINFFFTPWIACMFLAIGVPPSVATSVYPALWCLFVTPLLILELKIYGQWLSGGERRLSKVANPASHLSLVGNFVSAILAAEIGWKEPAVFFWAVGCAHYLVLLVTLYQRLPTAEVLPKELHPVFFLFVAAPSAASVAWKFIMGHFDYLSRIAYFVGLFLYASLAVRLNFFCGFRFSISWWAYTFPMTASAIASIHYSLEVKHPITQGMSVMLSFISAATVAGLFVSTILNGVFWGTLFPNDIAIAITSKRLKRKNRGLNSGFTNVLPVNKEDNLGNDTGEECSHE